MTRHIARTAPEADPTAVTPFRDLDEVRSLVAAFERGTLSAADWNHRAHLAVAMWYLTRWPEPLATDRMIRGIRVFNYAKGIRKRPRGGYHETLTLFWMGVAERFRRATTHRDPLEIINGFVRAPGGLPLVCFTEARLWSDEARRGWMEPDRAGLERATEMVLAAQTSTGAPSPRARPHA